MTRREDIWPIDPGRRFDLRELRDLSAERLRTGADGDAVLVFRGESAAWHNSLFVYRVDASGRFVDLRPVWSDASDSRFDPARPRDLDGRGPLREGDSVALSDVYGHVLAPGERFGLLLVADGARRIGTVHFADGGSWRLVDVRTGTAPGPDTGAGDVRLIHEDDAGVRSWSRGLWFATDPDPDGGPGHGLHPDGVEHVAWAVDGDGRLWLAFEDLDTRAYDRPARNFVDLVLEVRTTPLAAPACPLPLDRAHLDGGTGSLVTGADPGGRFGHALARGDFDGDGAVDLAVGAPDAAGGRGTVMVLSGFAGRPLDLAPARTVTLVGDAAGDRLGTSLAAADVDGDGRDELLVGAIGVDGGGPDSGAVYVVDVEAAGDGSVGDAAALRLDGLAAGDELGRSLDGGMDVDGDGFEDLVAGARLAEPDDARYSGGLSYVVFGAAGGPAGDLAALDGDSGFRIEGGGRFDQSGRSVALLGDIDGDGFADVAVGAPDADPLGRTNAGEVLVVLGGEDGFPASLAPADLDGVRGFRVAGPRAGAFAGFHVAAAGDVDGDGFDDLLVGSYGTLDDAGRGGAFLVYGREDWPTVVDLAAPAAGTVTRLLGPGGHVAGGLGRAVAAAGDVDGDGFDDLLVGARYSDPGGPGGEGIAYLVWGRDDRPAEIDLATLEADEAGCRLLGATADAYAGFAFAGPADIDGDGLDDLVVGAPAPPGGTDPGTVFVVYGSADESGGSGHDGGSGKGNGGNGGSGGFPTPAAFAVPPPPRGDGGSASSPEEEGHDRGAITGEGEALASGRGGPGDAASAPDGHPPPPPSTPHDTAGEGGGSGGSRAAGDDAVATGGDPAAGAWRPDDGTADPPPGAEDVPSPPADPEVDGVPRDGTGRGGSPVPADDLPGRGSGAGDGAPMVDEGGDDGRGRAAAGEVPAPPAAIPADDDVPAPAGGGAASEERAEPGGSGPEAGLPSDFGDDGADGPEPVFVGGGHGLVSLLFGDIAPRAGWAAHFGLDADPQP